MLAACVDWHLRSRYPKHPLQSQAILPHLRAGLIPGLAFSSMKNQACMCVGTESSLFIFGCRAAPVVPALAPFTAADQEADAVDHEADAGEHTQSCQG